MTSQNHNYPTRMHEVLGVETGEVNQVNYGGTLYDFWVDHDGWMYYQKANKVCEAYAESNGFIAYVINYPGCIIRKPRLSEEQVKQLQALVTLGFRWLIKNNDCSAYAYTYMPEKMDEWWKGLNAEVQLFIDMPTGVLYNLVSWSDPEPLDIVATLKAAGVEVE